MSVGSQLSLTNGNMLNADPAETFDLITRLHESYKVYFQIMIKL